jgi:aminoglycoside phosphotransferase (APT) family kinase protein
VVHGDCAPENVLVHEGQITAVVDWEQACYGDAAFDLAGMIFDIELGAKAEPDVLSLLYAAIHAQVPPDAWRLYTHIYAVRYASWAINTEMESQVLDTIARISR